MAEWTFSGQQHLYVDDTGTVKIDAGISNTPEYKDPYTTLAYDLQDISQSHHFKVNLSKIKTEYYARAFGSFLPVKNISYNEITFDNLTIPTGIFGNFPLMHRKQVGVITLTVYDKDTDNIEQQYRQWEAECFPKGKYVNFISNVAAEFKYSSYTVTGKLNKTIVLYVIPTGSYTINRSYEENNAKLLQFSLTVVGFKGNMAQGLQSSGGGMYNESLRSSSYYPEGF